MRAICCTFALAVLIACGGGDDKGTAPRSIAGSYTLNQANGSNLPALLQEQGGNKLEITAGLVVLNANGSFSDSYTLRETVNGQVTSSPFNCTGTWSQSGNSVTLREVDTPECGDIGTGSWDGNITLTVNWSLLGFTGVHRR